MHCRFQVYGDGRFLAERVGEVVDEDDVEAIRRIREIAIAKGRAVPTPLPVRDLRVLGPELF